MGGRARAARAALVRGGDAAPRRARRAAACCRPSSARASPRWPRGIRSTPSSSSRCSPRRRARRSSSWRSRRRSRRSSPRGSTASTRSSARCSSGPPSSARSSGPARWPPSSGGDEALGTTLLGLVRRELVEPAVSSIPGEDGFRFRHALIRDAAYAGIPKRTRADLHERFAGWLELHDGEDELVGYHLEQAYRYRDELGRARRPHAVARRAGGRAAHGRRAPRVGARRRTGGGQPARARRRAVAAHERHREARAPRARDRAHAIGLLRSRRGRARGGTRPRPCRRRSAARAAHADRARVLPDLHERGNAGGGDHARRRRRRFRPSRRSVTTAASRGRGTS